MHTCLLRHRLVPPLTEPIQIRSCSVSGAQVVAQSFRARSRLTPKSVINRRFSSRSRLRSSPFSQPRQASSLWSVTFAAIVISGGVLLQNIYSKPQKVADAEQHPQSEEQQQEKFLGVIDTLKMTTDQIPPGHVGNLTEEQEIKLQELWAMTLKVFGVKPEGGEDQASMRSAESTSESPSPEKKKGGKKRLGLFSRKDDEAGKANELNTENGISASLAGVKISDSDDKYGQLKDFQQAIADESPEDLRVTFWNMVKHDNPDALLLRFLRARKWDVHKALVMMISTMRWRLSEMHVDDDIMNNGEALALKQSQSSDPAAKKAGDEFLHQIRMGKSFLHGVDKNGRPMCLVRVRLHRAADQSPETLERYTVYTIETARMMLAPPIETATIIFDMTDFSLANMDYTPVKFMIKCFEANYPESLGAVLIHKAPWIFSGIWNIIKGWLDPVVAAKIHFTKSVDDLEKFIPRGRIMKELGGDEDFEYKYVEPQPDENAKIEDTATRDELIAKRQALCKEFQTATFAWIAATAKGDTEAVAAQKAKRADLTEKIRKGYWELDPYVRARSYYDRTGVIMGGGKIKFYPDLEVKVNGADS